MQSGKQLTNSHIATISGSLYLLFLIHHVTIASLPHSSWQMRSVGAREKIRRDQRTADLTGTPSNDGPIPFDPLNGEAYWPGVHKQGRNYLDPCMEMMGHVSDPVLNSRGLKANRACCANAPDKSRRHQQKAMQPNLP